MYSLRKELNRITARAKRKRNGENLRLVSNRQYRRLRAWCIRYRTEIILALVLALYQLLDAVSWAFWATALVFAAIALRHWQRRMGPESYREETAHERQRNNARQGQGYQLYVGQQHLY